MNQAYNGAAHEDGAMRRGGESVNEERFDVMDCAGEKTGATIARSDAHRQGVWHGAFHCLVVNERRGTALFQKRSREKTIAPGRFDVTAGGHYAAGEDAASAAPRELREETGLDVPFGELRPLGRRVFVYCFEPGVREYEFQDIFLLQRDVNPQELLLQREEVEGVIELDIEQGIALHSGKIRELEQLLIRPGHEPLRFKLVPNAFVPCIDRYYLRLLLTARRFVQGERELLLI